MIRLQWFKKLGEVFRCIPSKRIFIVCTLVVLACGSSALAEKEQPIVVLRFEGTTVRPHDNQPRSVERDEEPGAVSEVPLTYILVADPNDSVIYLYQHTALWRLDAGVIDEEADYYWKHADDGVLSLKHGSWAFGTHFSYWNMGTRSILADLFDVPIEGEFDDLIAYIVQLGADDLPITPSSTTQQGDVLRRRSIADNGNQIVVTTLSRGKIQCAVRAERVTDVENAFECNSIVFWNEKPCEIRRGRLTVKVVNELPAELQGIFDAPEAKAAIEQARLDAEVLQRGELPRKSALPSSMLVERIINISGEVWLVILSIIGFLGSLLFRVLTISKGKVSYE